MLALLARHSSILLILAALTGFTFPEVSSVVFPYLPYILFFLMLFTLIGIRQNELIRLLFQRKTWVYALYHAGLLTAITTGIAILFGASESLTLAFAAVAATGSLFATPAIARSVGLDVMKAMAMTIATTLLMPVVLYINLSLFQSQQVQLDLSGYLARLIIFIFGPMFLSALCHRYIPAQRLQRTHSKIAQLTILLVPAFPLGLVSEFRALVDQSWQQGLIYFGYGVGMSLLFFLTGMVLYMRHSLSDALLAGITSTNRNVLLTYTVAGTALGPDYLVLIGALQLPIYAMPMVVQWLDRKLQSDSNPLSPTTG
ncbi:hypothetical protein KDD30_20095 (plasmid) [Photobacterium sp. GJ3]|uniref:hypothetical protein n=1 Tax=Photobacterium sp. GJ3 TaxID=2829502 RepID=UPI001B8D64A0|nr:hypothetical protein [Photobacterium sp. GJ3]QUJ70409.1 hypothetical protein KDD30_20095 [Photobacterium sp. GJ3]